MIPFLLFSAMLAQQQSPEAVIKAGTQEVLLDVVARDKHGRVIRNLEGRDFTIRDDGVPQKITGFRVVHDAEIESAEAGPTTNAVSGSRGKDAIKVDPIRQFRLVTLVFERLGPDGRRLSRQAAEDFLGAESDTHVYFAVMYIDNNLKILQPFTADHGLIKQAIEHATGGTPTQFASSNDSIRSALDESTSASNDAQQLAAGAGRGGVSSAIGGASANAAMAQMMLSMMNFSEDAINRQIGRASLFSLMGIVKEQYRLPGRKTLIYFSEGWKVPSSLVEQFKSLLSAANRANVSVYAVDARGLLSASQNKASSDALAGAAAAGRRQWQAAVNRQSAPVTREEATMFDSGLDSIGGNGQNTLANIAESTGGFLIANSNDLRGPMRRVLEDMSMHYEITYAPVIEKYDGRFRKVSVEVDRPETTLQARNGYFALPPGTGDTLFPYEIPLLNALNAAPFPHNVEFRSEAMHFDPRPAGTECSITIEVPQSSLTVSEDKVAHTYTSHISLLALLKNSQGVVVEKLTQDLPYTAPIDKLSGFREGHMIVTQHKSLPPGRYTLEAAVMDREGQKIGARKSVFLVPPPTTSGLALSSVALIRRIDPQADNTDTTDPFRFQGGRITPTLSSSVPGGPNAQLALYFVIYPSKESQDKPQLTMEFLRDGTPVGRGTPALGNPDESGRIPYVAESPIAKMEPGNYEVRVIARQGKSAVEEDTSFTLTQN